MNVPTIEIDSAVAAEKAEEYQTAFERTGNPEDEALAQGFEELAKNRRLLSLAQVFADCPADSKARPRLAIARADRRTVHWTGWQFQADPYLRGPKPKAGVIPIRWRLSGSTGGWAQLPLIPPEIRVTRNLRKHFVLWEVEQWVDYESDVQPDRDPYLLRRVSSSLDLFVIVAEWELTELERWAAAQRTTAAR